MDLFKGEITLGNETFRPGYSFDDFMHSSFYTGQDGIRIIKLGIQEINSHKFVIRLFFRFGLLFSVSAICIDSCLTAEDENKRKDLHDSILLEHGVRPGSSFWWGKIESNYDPKGNISSIDIVYSNYKTRTI